MISKASIATMASNSVHKILYEDPHGIAKLRCQGKKMSTVIKTTYFLRACSNLNFIERLPEDVTKMENGEWGMGNGEWGMGNGEWGMGNGEWGMGNEK